jgi:membrane-bound ClpP family serine protease
MSFKLFCLTYLNNPLVAIICIIVGFFWLRYLIKRGVEIPENSIVQSDLSSILVACLLVFFWFVIIILKFVK